jgi:site-specific recombinase XerD
MAKATHSLSPSIPFLKVDQLGEHFDGFARKLADDGYSELTIFGYAVSVAHFAEWARRTGRAVRDLNDDAVERFAQHRCHCPGGRKWRHVSEKYVRRIRRFARYLEREGVVEARLSSPVPRPSMPDFREWLLQHRGATVRTADHYEGLLLRLSLPSGSQLAGLSAATLRDFVLREARCHSSAQTRCIITALRAYLRFLASTGRCRPGLDQAIPTIPQWRLSALPRYLPAQQVEQVVGSCNTETATGLRDRAILLLLARLGLRAGDIMKMRISDIDWHRGTVKVCGKGHREVCLPLPQAAGDAVLVYLQRARPPVAIEQLFLCVRAPHRPLGHSGTVSSVVSAALRRAGILHPPSRGATLLRHSAATAMLRAGASLETVSSMLRHRSLDMTAHYAKVDVAMLAPLAQPWPEGSSC